MKMWKRPRPPEGKLMGKIPSEFPFFVPAQSIVLWGCQAYPHPPPLFHMVHSESEAQSTYIGRDETGSVYLPTQLERPLQLYW